MGVCWLGLVVGVGYVEVFWLWILCTSRCSFSFNRWVVFILLRNVQYTIEFFLPGLQAWRKKVNGTSFFSEEFIVSSLNLI